MHRSVVIYVAVLLVCGLGILAILQHGKSLQVRAVPAQGGGGTASPTSADHTMDLAGQPPRSLWQGLQENLQHPLSRLFIQLILIMVVARGLGSLLLKVGQPAVVGEMVAGILLGPSLLGWLWPDAFNFIFPTTTLGTLRLLSQIGVCLFLFIIGMELDVSHLRHRAQTAVVVSHVSIVFPYFLGVAVSLWLYPRLAPPGASFMSFALFMGIAMSITAFPVLARILEERGLAKTSLGATAITCAAVDDLSAWTILAVVVALARAGDVASPILSLVFVLAFVAVMVFVARPRWARRLKAAKVNGGGPGQGIMVTVLAFVLASAFVTEVAGLHALFGAFLAGVVMPRETEFCHYLRVRMENMSSVFLLPLFFVFTGLRTQLGLLNGLENWLICAGLIGVATLGKLGGSMCAARWTGMAWSDALALGALMNTRGLMELIALNLGYDLGILSPTVFTMMVIMALVTTALTGPLLTLAGRWKNSTA